MREIDGCAASSDLVTQPFLSMRLGFHVSIAGGFKNVVRRARERQSETIQLFSRNPRAWKHGPLIEADIAIFRKEIAEHDIWPIFVHTPYLLNLASAKKDLFHKSLNALIGDLERSATLCASFLIMHVGSAINVEKGIEQMSLGINTAFQSVQNEVKLLLENTAGSGHELGHSFSQLRMIIDRVEQRARIGIVLDTAHAFAAGYDLRTQGAVDQSIADFDRTIGLEELHLVHLNDSKTDLGSRSDRHWHIFQGKIGQGMFHILHHHALKDLPFIMETPRTNLKEDLMNMTMVRQLLAQQDETAR